MDMKNDKDFEAQDTQVIEETGVDRDTTGGSDGKKSPLGGTVRLFGREFPKKAVAAGLGGLLVLALAGGGALYAATASQPGGGTAGEAVANVESDTDTEAGEQHVLSVGARADGYDAETSSPVIAHIVNEDEGVDYYHAYDANVEVALDVPAGGGYEVSLIAPVNADGSTYKAPDASTVQAVLADDADDSPADDADLPFTFEQVAAEDMSADDITGIAAQVAEAVRKGDETLTGENGARVVALVEKNLKANRNADEDAITEQSEAASEAVESESSQASTGSSNNGVSSDTGGSSTGSGSTGNSGSSSSSSSGSGQTSHTHDWVAQTDTVHHDAVYKTVHHEAEYTIVHHDAVTQERTICNNCGADITGNVDAHMKANIFNGCGSYSVKPVVVQAAYDEQVLVSDAWDEQVLVSGAWDETVTTGYRCSGCGATK